jgi:hypothetical protein
MDGSCGGVLVLEYPIRGVQIVALGQSDQVESWITNQVSLSLDAYICR